MSRTSSTCEWYIHITELPSIGPGPARAGTGHTYTNVPPGGTPLPVRPPPAPSLYGAPSELFS